MAERLRRRQDDCRAPRPADPPLRDRRNRQRELALQEPRLIGFATQNALLRRCPLGYRLDDPPQSRLLATALWGARRKRLCSVAPPSSARGSLLHADPGSRLDAD